jgi:hypothetical protein
MQKNKIICSFLIFSSGIDMEIDAPKDVYNLDASSK